MNASFSLAATGSLLFGNNKLENLPRLLTGRGIHHVAIILSSTFSHSNTFMSLEHSCTNQGVAVSAYPVSGEPSVDMVDGLSAEIAAGEATAIVGIGGGSVLDTAKAVSVMVLQIRENGAVSVQRFLEGVGDTPPPAKRLTLIAVPTTAGTGSEATKNAVIAKIGKNGFKKSLRHDAYIPDLVIIDPLLFINLPRSVVAASGLDAITQLLESYLSTDANPYSDALALDALERAGRAFPLLLTSNGKDPATWAEMAYSAYISGITMSSAGLGYVHGLAGPLGGLHEIPHGVACAQLLAPITKAIIQKLIEQGAETSITWVKLLKLVSAWQLENVQSIIPFLDRLAALVDLPSFATYGFTRQELLLLSSKAAKRGSPVTLDTVRIEEILLNLL
jgi:alcohol dehydrogenase class IV